MSRTRPLLPGEYAEGTQIVETTLRPVRLACLIPEEDPGLAARFAVSRSLAWGGHVGYALPYSRSEGLRQPWRRLLDVLDPDQVFALGLTSRPAVSPGVVNMNAPEEEPPRPLAYRLSDDLGRLVYTAEEGPERLFVGASTLMHTVLGAVGEGLKPPDSERFVIVPMLSQQSPDYLPVTARYGGVNDAELVSALNKVHSHRYRFDLNLCESVRVQEVGAAGDLLGVLLGDLSSMLEDGEAERALTLTELTLGGLQITGHPNPNSLSRQAPDDRDVGDYRPVIVTGEDSNVEDFALYWNLRSEQYFAWPFPVWMPLGLLEDAEAPAAIERALGRVRPSVSEPRPRSDDLLIVSASMGSAELQERLGDRYPEARIGVEDLIGLFTMTCEYRFATEKLPAHFDHGRASIQPPRPEELKKNLAAEVDYVAYEVSVDGTWLPQGEVIVRNLGWPGFHSRDYVSKRGNLRYVKQFNKRSSETDLLELRTPDRWTLLSSVFEERGYEVAPTAKSRTALSQLTLLGGVENLKVAASSKVHNLLKELSRGRGEDREYVYGRRTEPLSRFDSTWGKEVTQNLLPWLIKRRLLFRGADITCPQCELNRWYEVDRIGETWRCDGCKEDMPIPLHLQVTPWRYRINELYAHGLDQGALTPLLTLYAMHLAWGISSIHGDLGFYPCVELRVKDGAHVPFEHKEIDLVAIRGGNLILAECKESASPFSEPEEAAAFARQIGELVVLADHLGALQVLAASPTAFPEDKDPLLAEVPPDSSVDIVWLDDYDLLDPHPYFHPLNYPTATGDRADKPEGWDKDYLDWVRRSVTNQALS